MHSTHLRDLFSLHGKKITTKRQSAGRQSAGRLSAYLVILLIINHLTANAQITNRLYQSDYDNKTVKFGYFLGLPSTHFNLQYNNTYVLKGPYYAISSPSTMGLKMGGIMNIRIDDYFDVRFMPTVAIYGRRLEFKKNLTTGDSLVTNLRETAWFELPLVLKYKSERRGNVRMYVFGGICLALETNAVARKNRQQFSTTSTDFSIEYGVGIEFFKEYFKFAPELHFAHGISNLTDPLQNKDTNLGGISKMTTHTITLCFLFE